MKFILHNLRSGHNVGSLLRSADVFALEHIYLSGYTPIPPHKEIVKTALGSEQRVSWSKVENIFDLIFELHSQNRKVFSIEISNTAKCLSECYFEKDSCFILGNEVCGIEKEVIDQTDGCIMIEQFGVKKSLNVSVAGAIVMYEITKKH